MFELPLWEHDRLATQWLIVVAASVVASVTDLRDRRIPNLLTLPLFVAGLAWAFTIGGPLGLAESFAAALMVGFPFVILFLFAGGGAGDAKMMGAIGAWVGLGGGLAVLLCVTAAGIVLAIAHAVATRRTQAVLSNLGGIATGMLFVVLRHGRVGDVPRVAAPSPMQTIPYGIAILAGTAAAAAGVLLWT